LDPWTVIGSGNSRRQLQNSMTTSPNSPSWRFFTSVSLSSNRKHRSLTKPQDQPATTTTTSAATPCRYTTLTPTVVGLRKIGKRILGHHGKKGVRGPFIFKPSYCRSHGSDTNHRTKDCPIFLESKRKMEQDSNQLLQQSSSREVNNTMQWAPPHHQYSLSYPSLFQPQTHPNNQGQAPAYYQSYHYTITNHSQPSPAPQITYPSPVPQITYPAQKKTQIYKTSQKLTHLHHLCYKSVSLRSKLTTFLPTVQFSPSWDVLTPTSTIRGNRETTTDKSIAWSLKVLSQKLNGPTYPYHS
jgi:hypothetical protein